MRHTTHKRFGWALGLTLAAVLPWLSGCDDSDYDHDPPPGQGALVVDNWTGYRLYVYLDGQEAESVPANKHRCYDLEPGAHRVVLDGKNSDRSWGDDVDVLEGRLTVLEVRSYGSDYTEFDVRLYFD